MDDNIFNTTKINTVESNAFEVVEKSESYDRPPGNCPPGHFKAIQAGGRGHWVGDSCGCDFSPDGPSVTIDGGILHLMIIALMFMMKSKLHLKNNLKNLTL